MVKKIAKLDVFLETAEKRIGGSENEVQSNITDNESARIKGPHGYIQGYNGIAIAVSAHQVIVSAEAFGSGSDGGTGRFTVQDFTYNIEANAYICPNKKTLIDKGFVELNRNSGNKYQSAVADCKNCPFLEKCVASRGGKNPKRTLYIPVSKYEENLSDKMRKKIVKTWTGFCFGLK